MTDAIFVDKHRGWPGEVAGLTGQGSYVATDVQPTPFTLEYELG
jgi:hypothetical protein